MCGIVGYVGYRKAVPVLLHGLQRLEYRGYDSAGLAVLDEKSKKIIVEKQVGKIKDLQEYIWGKEINGNIGIAHTRWATHGPPSIENAHPHTSKSEAFAVVHNGIIENYAKLKDELIKKGYQFKSQTDSEVIAHLLEEYEKDLLTTVLKVAKMIEGAYAIGVISTVEPDKIVALRKGSPLVVGIGEGENFIASDIPAILEYTKTFIALDDEEIAVITKDKVEVYDINGNKVEKKPFTVKWDLAAAEKGGFKHFMLKEIYEQPKTITDTISGFFSDLNNPVYNEIKNIQNIVIIACGTSYHAGLVGKFWIEKFVKIPTIVDYASEFRYRDFPVNEKTLIIAISQSGETADTRFSAIDARKKSAKVLSIVNVVGSSLSRESDFVIYTYCGPEIGVAATKTFTAQLITLLLFSLKAGLERGNLTQEEFEKYHNDIIHLPSLVNEVLKQDKAIEEISYKYHNVKDFLFLGRGLNYPIALEGALKLKEISYIHAEGYPAGEMKHGPIALIDENLPVVCIVPKDSLYEKMISNIQEVKARKGIVISVSDSQDSHLLSLSDNIIKIPSVENENLYPIVSVIPLQLLAYHIATILGKDVDQPRNLAKTVTVE